MQTQADKTLYLIPLPIAEGDLSLSIPSEVINQIAKIQCFIAENAKTSRQFLKRVNPSLKWEEIYILELDKHNGNAQFSEIRSLFENNTIIGLMSEAGMPCIADPGYQIVRFAQDAGVKVKPMVGPSSILLALISSGLNGQNFSFNGYLPSKADERKKAISDLERKCRESTQLFIEAPYRNEAMFDDLLRFLQADTRLLLASDITGKDEWIICRTVKWWKQNPVQLQKIPCLFGIGK